MDKQQISRLASLTLDQFSAHVSKTSPLSADQMNNFYQMVVKEHQKNQLVIAGKMTFAEYKKAGGTPSLYNHIQKMFYSLPTHVRGRVTKSYLHVIFNRVTGSNYDRGFSIFPKEITNIIFNMLFTPATHEEAQLQKNKNIFINVLTQQICWLQPRDNQTQICIDNNWGETEYVWNRVQRISTEYVLPDVRDIKNILQIRREQKERNIKLLEERQIADAKYRQKQAEYIRSKAEYQKNKVQWSGFEW